ncbi:MAG: YlmH/Sll1252 family protein, partial [Oscillospiraceae bacterium]|nr:YlmH/Sll1252 family protein [Oscillospiraceae bacterium]
DKMLLSSKLNKNVFSSEFYPPIVWEKVNSLFIQGRLEAKFSTYGIFDEAERRIIKWGRLEENYPIELVKIEASSKFQKIEHKHYLGSILSLGIKREKIGDLIVQGDCCYFPTFLNIIEFLKLNLLQINKVPCNINIVDKTFLPEVNFEDVIIDISSYRLDAIVGSLCRVSRSASEEIIRKGFVQINFLICLEKNKNINFGDIITIKKLGKFKMFELIKITKSKRLKVLFKKYS